MQDISTQTLDAYTLHILSDQSMTPADRARHAGVAITSHVMQEFRLPMDTALPVEDGLIDIMEADLESTAETNMADLMVKSMDAYEAIEAIIPTSEVSDQKLSAGILYIPETMEFNGSDWPAGPIVDGAQVPLVIHGDPDVVRLVEATIEGGSQGWAEPTPEEQAKFDKFWEK